MRKKRKGCKRYEVVFEGDIFNTVFEPGEFNSRKEVIKFLNYKGLAWKEINVYGI